MTQLPLILECQVCERRPPVVKTRQGVRVCRRCAKDLVAAYGRGVLA